MKGHLIGLFYTFVRRHAYRRNEVIMLAHYDCFLSFLMHCCHDLLRAARWCLGTRLRSIGTIFYWRQERWTRCDEKGRLTICMLSLAWALIGKWWYDEASTSSRSSTSLSDVEMRNTIMPLLIYTTIYYLPWAWCARGGKGSSGANSIGTDSILLVRAVE
jgi:hypothetical protein